MSDFTFVTSNDAKVGAARVACDAFGITFDREVIDFVEIQALDGDPIAKHKVAQAYEKLQKPVVITDDSWLIPALGGFPGPYMSQINSWLSIDDFLNLTRSLEDRTIILRQIVIYQDASVQKLFSADIPGIILQEARGEYSIMHLNAISFDAGQHSAGELTQAGQSAIAHLPTSWDDLCKWLQKTNT